jgi:FkbM family methyltransferase
VRSIISAALRRYPFYDGYDRIALSKPLSLFAHFEPYAIARLRGGERMLICCRDHVGRTLLYMGDLEPRVSYIAKKFLRPGDCVLDIGANVGWFSIISSSAVGPSGIVHAFEPQPRIAALFQASLSMNEMKNVTVHQVALSDLNGTADFHVLKGNFGAGRLADVTGEMWSTIQVNTVNASAYLKSLNLPHVRLVKIDVEGHEETVFRNAHDFFELNRPDAIIFESLGEGPLLERPVAKLLSTFGYNLLSFDRSLLKPRLVPVREYDCVTSLDHVAVREGVTI